MDLRNDDARDLGGSAGASSVSVGTVAGNQDSAAPRGAQPHAARLRMDQDALLTDIEHERDSDLSDAVLAVQDDADQRVLQAIDRAAVLQGKPQHAAAYARSCQARSIVLFGMPDPGLWSWFATEVPGVDLLWLPDVPSPAAALGDPLGTDCARWDLPTIARKRETLADLLRGARVERPRQEGRAPDGRPRGMSAGDVLDGWERWGPLTHEPTGIAALDDMTGGGLVYGSVIVVNGAPDAGKTLLAAQIADDFLRRGITVGFLGVDEEPGDLLMRFLQRRQFSRQQCERRAPDDMRRMAESMAGLSVVFYSDEDTIESAAEDLATRATRNGTKAALFVDSLQTVRSTLEENSSSRHDQVTTRLRALRSAARTHRMIAVSTSEVSRSSYRGQDDRVSDLAAGKESGSIEYTARLLLMLRSVPGESDVVELRAPKNKFGRRHDDKEKGIHLRMDRVRQTLTEANDYVPDVGGDQEGVRASAFAQETVRDAAIVAAVLAKNPGVKAKDLESLSAVAAKGMGSKRFGRARALLGAAVQEIRGARTTVHLFLNGGAAPAEVVAEVPLADRPAVLAARHPEDGTTSRVEPRSGALARVAPVPERDAPRSPIGGGRGSSGAGDGDDISERGASATRLNPTRLNDIQA